MTSLKKSATPNQNFF